MLKGTPFHSRTAPLSMGQNWRRWSGYMVASSYDLSHEREYAAIRNSAALFDVSPLYKYWISGRDAEIVLNRITTRDITRCAVGQVLYTTWCDEHGKVIDDGTVSRLREDAFRLTSADPSLLWLYQNANDLKVEIADVSAQLAAVSLQGPQSRNILKQLCAAELDSLRYFRLTETQIDGAPVTISRTGYTGDLGYELWLDSQNAETVWDALIRAGVNYGLTPAGMLALDLARVEAGLMLIEVDYVSAKHAVIESQKSSPYELGLGWTVALNKDEFVGKRALAREHRQGSAWRFVGIEVDWDSLEAIYASAGLIPQLPAAAWRTSVPLYADDRQVGYASSGCWSPLLKKYIALAHLECDYAKVNTPLMMEMTVEHKRRQALARVAPTPFFNPERKRL